MTWPFYSSRRLPARILAWIASTGCVHQLRFGALRPAAAVPDIPERVYGRERYGRRCCSAAENLYIQKGRRLPVQRGWSCHTFRFLPDGELRPQRALAACADIRRSLERAKEYSLGNFRHASR